MRQNLPILPHFKSHGRSERTYRKAAEFNNMAQSVADHVHSLILANSSDVQVYSYFEIAHAMGLEVDQVRAAITRGGFNGITFGVNAGEREELRNLQENRGPKR